MQILSKIVIFSSSIQINLKLQIWHQVAKYLSECQDRQWREQTNLEGIEREVDAQ